MFAVVVKIGGRLPAGAEGECSGPEGHVQKKTVAGALIERVHPNPVAVGDRQIEMAVIVEVGKYRRSPFDIEAKLLIDTFESSGASQISP